jgi:hypothetical protein
MAREYCEKLLPIVENCVSQNNDLKGVCLLILADLVEADTVDLEIILRMIDAKHPYLQNDTRLMGTIREDLKDFPLIRGHFYNFEEEPDPESSQANILWCFKNII